MSSDPSDLNPLSSSPSTTPVATASSGGAPQTVGGTPPPDFVTAVNRALQGRLGVTKFGLIPAADKKALIDKIWQDPSIETYYTANHSVLASDVNAAGQFGALINSVMQGQGNDPSTVTDYTNMLQAAGVPLTASEQAGLAGATQAVNAPVPRPFNTAVISGYKFGDPMPPGGWIGTGQSFGWDKHYGNDYGTKAGDRIVTPFAGTATVETGVEGYGNIVYVTLDNGWKMGFGHVANGSVQNGQRVNPGDLIAIAGHNIGSAQGSVTLVTWQDPQGKFHDPSDVLNPIFQGATFSTLSQAVPNEINPAASGTGMPTVNKVLDTEYPTIKSDWQTYYGTPPSPEDVYDVLNHGSAPAQWSDYIRSRPSHIDNLNQGQYYDMRQMADGVSTTVLGHPATDSIVAELSQQGITSKQAVTNWYNEHGVTGIDQKTYQEIYQAVTPIMSGVFGETAGADPRTIKTIHDQQGNPDVGFTK
jgi:murein DD-endopeptidase MepM/ murein hydrolase activator NlpD